jgi:hypothetical protein
MRFHIPQVMLALTVLASLGHAGSAFGQHPRPFRLVGSGQSVLGPDGRFTGTATGVATHLGRWTGTGAGQLQPTDNPQVLAFHRNIVFTAANGDQLYAVIENGRLNVLTGIATSIYRFTGGTGRFRHATGRTAGRSENPPDGSFRLVLMGTICY